MRGALEGLRVVELGSGPGTLCARLLGDLGAEVVKVEPPEGDPLRAEPPFWRDEPHPEGSLTFLALSFNKRSVVLDAESPAQLEALGALLAAADVVVESPWPGASDDLLRFLATVRGRDPRVVWASVTPYGLTGPYAGWPANDLTCFAMGGLMWLCGDVGRPPLAPPNQQAYQLASLYALVGVLAALASGRGQLVEVAVYDVLASLHYQVANYSANELILRRAGARVVVTGAAPSGVYPCRDGYVHLFVLSPAHWRAFFDWMGRPAALSDPVWENRHFRAANVDVIEPFVQEFVAPFHKQEFFVEGQRRRIPVAPVNTPADFGADAVLAERSFFVEVEHPHVGRVHGLGVPIRLSATPWQVRRPAPLVGQHTGDVLRELQCAAGPPRPAAAPSAGPALALAGLRVLDLTLAIAGPMVSRLLGELGAEVIKIESAVRQQRGRSGIDTEPRVARQQHVTFADLNRNKRCVTVNLKDPRGCDLLRRLAARCDVVVENFSPRVVEGWGLGYEALREVNPQIIMARLPGFGLSGPRRDYLSVAQTVLAASGLYHYWSYPGEPPIGPPSVHPDYVSAALGAAAVLVALRHRERTGEGQLIEVAQVEATAALLGPELLDFFLNGRVLPARGNAHPVCAPYGCYRCRGEDAWCTLAVEDDAAWQRLGEAMERPAWHGAEHFATASARVAHREELDALVESWTREHTARQVMRRLQRYAIPAGVVQTAEDLWFDPHLQARGFFFEVDEPGIGRISYPGVVARLSRTPGRASPLAPLGQDNEYVFGELLGLSPGEVADLTEAGVLA